jgi:hypothetical protein
MSIAAVNSLSQPRADPPARAGDTRIARVTRTTGIAVIYPPGLRYWTAFRLPQSLQQLLDIEQDSCLAPAESAA